MNEANRTMFIGLDLYYSQDFVDDRNKEIERLNNIINELEKRLYERWLEWKDSECESNFCMACEDKSILTMIKELKGSDKE